MYVWLLTRGTLSTSLLMIHSAHYFSSPSPSFFFLLLLLLSSFFFFFFFLLLLLGGVDVWKGFALDLIKVHDDVAFRSY